MSQTCTVTSNVFNTPDATFSKQICFGLAESENKKLRKKNKINKKNSFTLCVMVYIDKN